MTAPAAPTGDAASDFPIEWLEPRDAELTWGWDDMHMPHALAPLAGDYVLMMTQGFAYGYERLDVPIQIKSRIWNGYAYFTADIPLPESEHEATWELRSIRAREHIDATHGYWIGTALPEIQAIYADVAAIPVEDLAGPVLADAWEEAWSRLGRPWRIHFYVIRGPYQVLEDLADLYESIVVDAAPGDALALIGGAADELQAVETELEGLVAMLRGTPELMVDLPPTDAVGSLAARPDAAPFLAALDAFLARHGHLGQNWDNLAEPSWIEEPNLLMAEIAKRAAKAPRTTADVLFLYKAEIAELLRTPTSRHALIADRRTEHAHWSATRPPRTVGKPAEDGDGDRFDGVKVTSTDPNEVRGTGASAGVARGTARVVLDQATFGAVQPGDIIVCTSSNPSWIPLFAIAGGLVTDTGGVLSHAGVVAREFGLPAVVGTQDGTTRIADGRLVELDGSTGIVRLL